MRWVTFFSQTGGDWEWEKAMPLNFENKVAALFHKSLDRIEAASFVRARARHLFQP